MFGMGRAWQGVADEIRRHITAGSYAPGDRLPSGDELMARFRVSRGTIQNAIDALRREGVVVAVSGHGWYVSERKPVVRLARDRLSRQERDAGRGAFMSDAHSAGFAPAVTVKIRREPSTEAIAALLGIDSGAEVVVRDRVMRADGEVVQLAVSWLPVDVAGGTVLEQVDTGSGGTYARLPELGFPLTQFSEATSAPRATADEAAHLGLTTGERALQVVRIAYSGDRAVEVNRMLMRPDRYELVYGIPAE